MDLVSTKIPANPAIIVRNEQNILQNEPFMAHLWIFCGINGPNWEIYCRYKALENLRNFSEI